MDFQIENFSHLQSPQSIVPVQAIVTYQNENLHGDQEFLMAKHDFVLNDDEYILGDAKLLSVLEQHEIALTILNSKEEKSSSAFIQENILAVYPDGFTWFIKAKVWTMRFSISGKTRVFKIPMPPHVAKIRGNKVQLFAVKKNTRPTQNTPLFISPVPNVYASNNLCSGSVKFPTSPTQAHIAEIEQGIFNTINTHSHIKSLKNVKSTDHVKLLISLANDKHFSIKNLLPLSKSLNDII